MVKEQSFWTGDRELKFKCQNPHKLHCICSIKSNNSWTPNQKWIKYKSNWTQKIIKLNPRWLSCQCQTKSYTKPLFGSWENWGKFSWISFFFLFQKQKEANWPATLLEVVQTYKNSERESKTQWKSLVTKTHSKFPTKIRKNTGLGGFGWQIDPTTHLNKWIGEVVYTSNTIRKWLSNQNGFDLGIAEEIIVLNDNYVIFNHILISKRNFNFWLLGMDFYTI